MHEVQPARPHKGRAFPAMSRYTSKITSGARVVAFAEHRYLRDSITWTRETMLDMDPGTTGSIVRDDAKRVRSYIVGNDGITRRLPDVTF